MKKDLPVLKPKEVLKALKRAGFYIHHQTGSHIQLRHSSKTRLRVTVSRHDRFDLPRPVITRFRLKKYYNYFKNRTIFSIDSSGFLRKECSHMIRTFHPCWRKVSVTLRSLARFFFNFVFQNSLGKTCSQLGSRQPCQKSLCRKTALHDFGNAISGLPITPL